MRLFAGLTVIVVVLLGACTPGQPADRVADQFVHAYFARSDMAAAVKLASGSAKENLATSLQQIEAAGSKEPPHDVARVKVSLVESQAVASDAIRFVYRIDPEVAEARPITAILRLSKEGTGWYVSEFSQIP